MMALGTAEKIVQAAPRGVHAPVHFSNLKMMNLSPAHFHASCHETFQATADMREGTIVHHRVLGPHRTKPLVKYEGQERKGNAWLDFKALHPEGTEIVTAKEWERADAVSNALLKNPAMLEYLEGAYREKPLAWESGGIKCETDGIDLVQIVGGMGLIADLKRTSCTEPRGFQRHAFKQLWHVQMAFYEEAANANGIDTSRGLFLLGVEPDPPYAFTPLRLTTQLIDLGRRTYIKWLETLRRCRGDDHWPGYTQTVVDFDVPEWMSDDE